MGVSAALDFDAVDLVGAARHYGRRRALARTTLTLRAGELTGLFGPNGAGKSTMLGLLSTLVRPTAGEVRYGASTSTSAGDQLRNHIGMLGHDLFLYGDLTARENLTFFAQLYKLDDLDSRVAAALQSARLTDRADDRASSLSRGLRQRLALERALIHRPRLVLLDEPFTGLDDESVSLLTERLRGLSSSGAIVVMATHDFEHVDAVVDRMICLREGRAREIAIGGAPLRDHYRRAMAEAWS